MSEVIVSRDTSTIRAATLRTLRALRETLKAGKQAHYVIYTPHDSGKLDIKIMGVMGGTAVAIAVTLLRYGAEMLQREATDPNCPDPAMRREVADAARVAEAHLNALEAKLRGQPERMQ